ncbi:CMP-N-acetylneuraminate-beta-1,4-galactoside alpha-2,3-sialyltransferase-like isoform X1 [Glandiceps talaboti]
MKHIYKLLITLLICSVVVLINWMIYLNGSVTEKRMKWSRVRFFNLPAFEDNPPGNNHTQRGYQDNNDSHIFLSFPSSSVYHIQDLSHLEDVMLNHLHTKSKQMAVPVAMVNSQPQSCIPHLAMKNMKILSPKFDEKIPVFLSPGFQRNLDLMSHPAPFGLEGGGRIVSHLLDVMPDYSDPTEKFRKNGCKRCVIVGSGGIIKNTGLGPYINQFDVVFRLNAAPVHGYEVDVGNKTTLRVAYPESTFLDPTDFDPDSIYGFVPFKNKDFEWLDSMFTGAASPDGFWQEVPFRLPKRPGKVRLINPLVVKETAFDLIGFPYNGGQMDRNTPTTGTVLIMLAVRICDEVHVAGFGYDFSRPYLPTHYYDAMQMEEMKTHLTHDIPLEKLFLKKLVEYKVITDITKGM